MICMYSNFYQFEVFFGFFIALTVTQFGWNTISIIFFIASIVLLLHGLLTWKRLADMEVRIKNAKLNFDIVDIHAENDIEFEPDETGFHQEHAVSNFKITVNIYNNTGIDNVVRNIEVKLKTKSGKELKCSDVIFSPIKVPKRDYIPYTFDTSLLHYEVRRDDKIIVAIKTMDGKPSTKDFPIKNYYTGSALRNFLGEP